MIYQGSRNTTLHALGRNLRDEGRQDWQEMVRQSNKDDCRPPLPDDEIEKIIRGLDRA